MGKKIEIPYRITVANDEVLSDTISFLIRPEVTIPKRVYEMHHIDRMSLLSASPFCDIADELIEIFQNESLVFPYKKQFAILKSQFKTIGYNFNANPKILWHTGNEKDEDGLNSFVSNSYNFDIYSERYAQLYIELMRSTINTKIDIKIERNLDQIKKKQFDLTRYKPVPGVYYFFDNLKDILYVGKAKNIKKRLQSHFSNTFEANTIDYSKVCSISVDYTGNDIIAQLLESDSIKILKPLYNTQQIDDAAPFIINLGSTAKGIHRLKITRKDIQDNMPEKHFNRLSVKQSLEEFCTTYHLCRKHCGLETVKGPCSNYTLKHQDCVCAGAESIVDYNVRFDKAYNHFLNRKTRKIYKLKGRSADEDAFIYTINGIYEGYGFIDKNDTITTENDILGNLISMSSNYDTSRILSNLPNTVLKENILILE